MDNMILVYKSDENQRTIVKVNDDIVIGDGNVQIMAGPCAIESLTQIDNIALNIKNNASILRGGAYKMRTSPYSFQGLGKDGIKYLYATGKKYHMPIISEITSINEIDEFIKYVDIIQVGARSMQNYELLSALGKTNKPILLKRGFANTIDEWLQSAEYILKNGNKNVILCERGIKTFETRTRFTLDLSSIPLIKKLSHLPVVVDPSHAAGHSELVKSLSMAAIAAGADGLLIEVHNNPSVALSDSSQALNISEFKDLVESVKNIANAMGKKTNE